jgi:hypothetical protein
MTILFNTRKIRRSSSSDIVRGAGSLFNLSGNTRREYRFAESAAEADSAAIQNDWEAIGADLVEATETYRAQYRRKGD